MISRRIFSVGMTAAAAMQFPRQAFAATSTLDLSTVLPDGSFHTENAKLYASEVLKATNGEVKIQVHSGGSLGFKGPDHLRAVRDGLVPMADIHASQQAGDEPIFAAETLPFLVGSPDELRVLHKHLRPLFDAAAQRNNQKILYVVPWPAQYFFLKTRSENLEGLRNVKVRVSDKNIQDMCAAVGMSPVLIPWVETVPALASGAISGVLTSAVSGVDARLWEFVKYAYPTNHTWISQMVNINLDAWKKLSKPQQESMERIASALEPKFWANTTKVDADSMSRLTGMKMEVVPISTSVAREMRARTSSMVDAFMKKVPASEKPLRAYLAEVKRA